MATAPIPLHRVAAGIAIHFWPVAIAGAVAVDAATGGLALGIGHVGLVALEATGCVAALALPATAALAIADAVGRRRHPTTPADDETRASEAALASAMPWLATDRHLLDAGGAAGVDALRGLASRWRHDDPDMRRIARDLDRVRAAFRGPLRARDPEGRATASREASGAVRTLADAATRAVDAAERRTLDEADAVARYVAAAHGGSPLA